MKSTGIVRHVDEMGRLVLPIELRVSMDINPKDPLEVFVKDNMVVLKKYYPACHFCGNADNVEYFKGKIVCKNCIDEIKNNM